jgi:importin-4
VFTNECMSILSQMLFTQDTQLTSVTIDTIGSIAESVGQAAFAQYYHPTMTQVLASLEQSDAGITECAFIMFASLASVDGQAFAQYLSPVVQRCIEMLGADDEGEYGAESDANGDISLESEDVSLENEEDGRDGLGMTSLTQEKQSAARCLGQLFTHIPKQFLQYVTVTLPLLGAASEHYNEQVRGTAITSLLEYIQSYKRFFIKT